MQTILKIVCDKRGQAHTVEDYLVRFCEKAAGLLPVNEFPSTNADDVAFARDDTPEFQENCTAQSPAQLGSFGTLSQMNSAMTLVFVNPVIVSYRPDGQSLRLWVGSPSERKAGNTESTE
jgi:hypothetical protein